jgi:hypothetical protein
MQRAQASTGSVSGNVRMVLLPVQSADGLFRDLSISNRSELVNFFVAGSN